MEWIDYAILLVVLFSGLISLLRGFIREALSLVGWVAAFLVARQFYKPLSEYLNLSDSLANPTIRYALAGVILFALVLFLVAILGMFLGHLLTKAGLSQVDRALGLVFGAARGVLISAAILFLMAVFTRFPNEPWWKASVLVPHFQMIAQWFIDFMATVPQQFKAG